MQVIDAVGVILSEDKLVCALFDGRYDAIGIVKIAGPDKEGKHYLDYTSPDGEERLYWLDKFGLLTEDELIDEAEKLKETQKRGLYEKLKLDFEGK